VAELIKDKVGVEAKVVGYRVSGTVVVVRLEDEETKREVMRNKSKLKGENIFIENDLSWEERNVQWKINRWVKEQRRKGMDVKVGIGRVRVKGIWWAWGDVEREELRREGERKEDEKEGREDREGAAGGEGEEQKGGKRNF